MFNVEEPTVKPVFASADRMPHGEWLKNAILDTEEQIVQIEQASHPDVGLGEDTIKRLRELKQQAARLRAELEGEENKKQ